MDTPHFSDNPGLVAYDATIHCIYSATDPETFPAMVLPALVEATRSQCVAMCANAFLAGDPLLAIAFAGDTRGITWQRFPRQNFNDHPTSRYNTTPAPDRAVRLTDHFSSLEALQATQHYQQNMRPLGLDYELTLLLDTALPQRLGISIARAGQDYTDAEVELFTCLGPHLKRAFHHAQTLAQLRAAAAPDQPSPVASWRDVDLTPRESEILRWLATGHSNREIAQIFKIAPATVKTHVERILQKLGIKTRAAAAAALRNLPPVTTS